MGFPNPARSAVEDFFALFRFFRRPSRRKPSRENQEHRRRKGNLASGVSMSLLPLLDNERKFMQAIQNITDTGSLRGISMQGISLRKPRRFFALILTTASSLTKGTLPLSLFNISWNKPSWKRSRFHRRNVSVHQVKF